MIIVRNRHESENAGLTLGQCLRAGSLWEE
jgi:hypothetical protein